MADRDIRPIFAAASFIAGDRIRIGRDGWAYRAHDDEPCIGAVCRPCATGEPVEICQSVTFPSGETIWLADR